MLERVTVTRYVTPLREGGSLPGLVEADNLGPVHGGLTDDPRRGTRPAVRHSGAKFLTW